MDPLPKKISKDVIETFELFGNLIAFELEAEENALEREEALKLARQSDQAKARFMSILGHDLRSPLNTIMMAATVQKMGKLDAEKDLEMSEKIIKTAKRMQFLIEDLLDTTQTFQGDRIKIERKNIDLSSICFEIIDEFKVANPSLNIQFHTQGKCMGEWDEGRIGQVLTNLLSNAVSYGNTKKPIKVDLIEECDEVILQVNNQGNLINEEVKEQIFTPFWRGARKKTNSSGLGLGLYIVKQIVESHDGTINFESTPEYGTTFTVRFNKTKAKHHFA